MSGNALYFLISFSANLKLRSSGYDPALPLPGAQVLLLVWKLRSQKSSSPPGSSVQGISQARILEWVAASSSRGSSGPRDRTWVSCVPVLAGRFFTAERPGKPKYLRG